MIHHGWFVLCERASFDLDTNAVTLTDCVEQLGAASFPATMHRLVCAAYLFRDDVVSARRVPVRVVVEPPGRREVSIVEGHADFDVGHTRCRMRFFLDFFQFKTAGRYHFRLEVSDSVKGWVTVGRLPVDVVAFPSSESESSQSTTTAKKPSSRRKATNKH